VSNDLSQTQRDAILKPLRELIDSYVLKFSDKPLRYLTGGTYGAHRYWVKCFIEHYVIAHGRLPTGKHLISVNVNGAGYSNGTVDFSDLGQARS
jgi:hypothetical protein